VARSVAITHIRAIRMAAISPSVDECKQDMIELFYGLPMLATWPGSA
jgi:hypothetical protein